MNSGVASRLVRIDDLLGLPFNTKVRFLGCVIRYDVDSGILLLSESKHHPIQQEDHKTVHTIAGVDISAVHVKAEQLEIGSWINIVGYTSGPKYKPSSKGSDEVLYQAVRLTAQQAWASGSIDIEQYFNAVDARKRCFEDIA